MEHIILATAFHLLSYLVLCVFIMSSTDFSILSFFSAACLVVGVESDIAVMRTVVKRHRQ